MQLRPKNTVPEPTCDSEAILEVLVVVNHMILFQVGIE